MTTHIRTTDPNGYFSCKWGVLLGMCKYNKRMCYIVDFTHKGGIVDFWVASDSRYEIAEEKKFNLEGSFDWAMTGDLVGVIYKNGSEFYFVIGSNITGKTLFYSEDFTDLLEADIAMSKQLREISE